MTRNDRHDRSSQEVDVLHAAPQVALTHSSQKPGHYVHGEVLIKVNSIAALGQSGGQVRHHLSFTSARGASKLRYVMLSNCFIDLEPNFFILWVLDTKPLDAHELIAIVYDTEALLNLYTARIRTPHILQ